MCEIVVTMPAPSGRGTHAANVLREGHRPGWISGAGLRGKARQYGRSYARAAACARQHAAKYGVGVIRVAHGALVWGDVAGRPVRIELESTP